MMFMMYFLFLLHYEETVLFLLLNGETYDYIGSTRVVYDMKQKMFPNPTKYLSTKNIKLFIELSQLMSPKQLYYHYRNASVSINYFYDLIFSFYLECTSNSKILIFINQHYALTRPKRWMKVPSRAYLNNFLISLGKSVSQWPPNFIQIVCRLC